LRGGGHQTSAITGDRALPGYLLILVITTSPGAPTQSRQRNQAFPDQPIRMSWSRRQV